MLLAFTPGNGRLRPGRRGYLHMGLAGAILTDLALRGAIAVDPRPGAARKRRVRRLPAVTGDPFLDAAAGAIAAQQPRTIEWWVRNGFPGMQAEPLARLSAAGLVATERGLLRQRIYLARPQAQDELLDRVDWALTMDPALAAGLWTTDPWTAGLVSLSHACLVQQTGWLPRDLRRLARTNLRMIWSADPIGQAVHDIVLAARSGDAGAQMVMIATGI